MKTVDFIVLGLIAVAVVVVSVLLYLRKKRGQKCFCSGCCGSCSDCNK